MLNIIIGLTCLVLKKLGFLKEVQPKKQTDATCRAYTGQYPDRERSTIEASNMAYEIPKPDPQILYITIFRKNLTNQEMLFNLSEYLEQDGYFSENEIRKLVLRLGFNIITLNYKREGETRITVERAMALSLAA